MATVKLQNDKVILKGGNVSCECCFCDEDFSINGRNVFEITKEEHDAYRKGGVWSVSTIWDQSEIVPSPSCTGTSSVSKSTSQFASGCSHDVSDQASGTTRYTGTCYGNISVRYRFVYGIRLRLRGFNKKYYARYVAFSNVSTSTISSSPTGYPPNVNFNVDGNNLTAFGNWSPEWTSYSGYQNTSTATLTATFTPQ